MGKVFVAAKDVKEGRFIDTRYDLQDRNWGKQAFQNCHIQGAIHWDLEQDLSEMTKSEGRHPMPSKEQLQHLFEQSGLNYDDIIYIYDQGGAPFAARAWWMLKYANFPNVYIVNGGFEALKEAGKSVTAEKSNYDVTDLVLGWNDAIYSNRADVKNIVDGVQKAVLLDARSNERYRGENEPIDKVAGHIPTAKNFDWEQLKQGSELHANDQLVEKFKRDEEIVVYCGSGVTASPLYAILADSGYENLKLYVGSYSDWITQYEVETGENQ
ncbi:sulfurtransferase [Ureibacillus aquaedulcis]|uniref:Sulfurtransferase n=1 Tax=Ureibacillus aquaedulcis TaxID=3058421 RepID=A0ABT8GQW5_9BACL|nr:sulfurtransferase [Ureibacillus sp. BA0131]MDN4493807.1 sulfurtransferase [Ureibacillus sp. BA0131]